MAIRYTTNTPAGAIVIVEDGLNAKGDKIVGVTFERPAKPDEVSPPPCNTVEGGKARTILPLTLHGANALLNGLQAYLDDPENHFHEPGIVPTTETKKTKDAKGRG